MKQKRNCATALNDGGVIRSKADISIGYGNSVSFAQAVSDSSVFFNNPYFSECGAITSTILLA